MEERVLNHLAEDLLSLFLLFHKKVVNPNMSQDNSGMSRSHYEVMFLLHDMGRMPMNVIARALNLSKPYMTALTDKLASEDLAVRLPDDQDRRVINIELTEKGRDFISEHRKFLENDIKLKISCLRDEELGELFKLAKDMKRIISRLNLNGT